MCQFYNQLTELGVRVELLFYSTFKHQCRFDILLVLNLDYQGFCYLMSAANAVTHANKR